MRISCSSGLNAYYLWSHNSVGRMWHSCSSEKRRELSCYSEKCCWSGSSSSALGLCLLSLFNIKKFLTFRLNFKFLSIFFDILRIIWWPADQIFHSLFILNKLPHLPFSFRLAERGHWHRRAQCTISQHFSQIFNHLSTYAVGLNLELCVLIRSLLFLPNY